MMLIHFLYQILAHKFEYDSKIQLKGKAIMVAFHSQIGKDCPLDIQSIGIVF